MIIVTKGGFQIEYDRFVFPGGEVSVRILTPAYKLKSLTGPIVINAKLKNSEDFIVLANLRDALIRLDTSPIKLFLPYVPYARQDRVCNPGDSFSLRVFIVLLNALCFDCITVVDPHSLVAPTLLESVGCCGQVISQFEVIFSWQEFQDRIRLVKFVSPDAGSNKKIAQLATFFQHADFIRADKLRDLATGKIKETIIYCDDLHGQDVAICDDICDGGATFIELAKVLKQKNCGKIILYITHGIFSKGVQHLLDNGIDEIWTTNSYYERSSTVELTQHFHILNLEKFI